MPTVNQPIADNLALLVTAGLLLIVALLAVIAVLLWGVLKKRPQAQFLVQLNDEVARLQRAAEHHADVSAVVAMMRQLDELDEDAVELLERYPESVRAAAWLHYINRLGADLQAAQQRLSNAHQGTGPFANYYSGDLPGLQKKCQQHVDDLRAKLDKAIELSGQTGGLRSV